MNIKIVFSAKDTTKEDLRAFVTMVKEWELRTPKATVTGVLFVREKEISNEDASAIFEGIYPEFENLIDAPVGPDQMLRLGSRGIVIDGKLVGTCGDLSLTLEAAGEADIEALQEAKTISLVRMAKG